MPGQHCLIIALMLTSATALSGVTPPTQPVRPTPKITRADLAEAYLRLERTFQRHPPKPGDRARVHRTMDKAAYYFFAGNASSAVRTMNELCDLLRGAAEPDLQSFVHSLRVRASPRIAHQNRRSVFNIRINQLHDLPVAYPVDLNLVIRADDAGGRIVFEQPLDFRPDSPLPSISTKQPDAAPGRYRVELVSADGQTFDVGRWFVIDKSLDTQRTANEKRLSNLDTREGRIFQAWAACRARNALLVDRPSEDELAQHFADPIELAREVNSEVEALLRGEDPYFRRTGEYYRSIPAGAMFIPAWVYAPPAAKDGKPMPLVIALHGAGADEAIFMRGYGAGAIKRLADQHGFIVVAPSTYWVMPNPSAVQGILGAAEADYAIDRSRVYVVGHSLGAMAAAGLAVRHPRDLAAVALVAGGRFRKDDSTCPALILAAELDPLMTASELQKSADEARASGLPVEFRMVRDAGHVLVCDEVLDEAIEWLLTHRAPDKR